jgi:predicted DNA-binding protein YlxM (UPF0122 family)
VDARSVNLSLGPERADLSTDRQVHLFKLHAAGEHAIVELAQLFEVSPQTVYRVLEALPLP